MAEEVKDDTTTDETKSDELTAPDEVLDTEPLLEPEGTPDPDTKKVHPLTPGGRRFEQVYAESKQAKRDLVKERELRIAAEAKLEALNGKAVGQTNTETEYSWSQLEEFISQGRITRADAEAHREQILERKLANKIKGDFTKESASTYRTNALAGRIDAYCKAVPAILVEGSDERERLDEEFNFLASVHGVEPDRLDDSTRKALQLTALRTVYGPVEVLSKQTDTKKPDTHQGLPGGVRPAATKNADQVLLDKLTKTEVAHYNKMFRAGRYPGGWKDVVAELKYEAPVRRGR